MPLESPTKPIRATWPVSRQKPWRHSSRAAASVQRTGAGMRRAAQSLKYVQTYGIKQDLERFAGGPLTSTQRVYWQREIRALEAAGLVDRIGILIRPLQQEPAHA